MSFLKKEDSSSKSDWLFFVILLVGGGAFYWYYDQARTESFSMFDEASVLYEAEKWPESLEAYEKLQTAPWKNDSLDSVLYLRHSELSDRQITQWSLVEEIEKLILTSDTLLIKARLKEFKGTEFLSLPQKENLKKWTLEYEEDSASK